MARPGTCVVTRFLTTVAIIKDGEPMIRDRPPGRPIGYGCGLGGEPMTRKRNIIGVQEPPSAATRCPRQNWNSKKKASTWTRFLWGRGYALSKRAQHCS